MDKRRAVSALREAIKYLEIDPPVSGRLTPSMTTGEIASELNKMPADSILRLTMDDDVYSLFTFEIRGADVFMELHKNETRAWWKF